MQGSFCPTRWLAVSSSYCRSISLSWSCSKEFEVQVGAALVRPLASLLPASLPAEKFVFLLLVLILWLRRRRRRAHSEGAGAARGCREVTLRQAAGLRTVSKPHAATSDGRDNVWKPALAEIEEALVPAFIIEELEDGRYTVFVASVPTPLAGAVYILNRERVHPLNIRSRRRSSPSPVGVRERKTW